MASGIGFGVWWTARVKTLKFLFRSRAIRLASCELPKIAASAGEGQPLLVRDFTPTFTVHQMLKDLELILGAGKALQVPLSQTATTQQWMLSAIAQGDGQQDYATIIKVLERASGLNP